MERRLRLTGALAGLVTLVAMLALRGVTGQESLVELVAETVLQATPIVVFEFFLRLLQGLAKPLLLTSVILGFVWVFAGIGRLDTGSAVAMSRGRRVLRVLWLVLGLWIPSTLFAAAITTFVPSVSLSNGSLLGLTFALLVIATVYALAFYASYPLAVAALARASTRVDSTAVDRPPADLGRRQLIARTAVAGVGLLSVGYLGKFVSGVRGGAIGGGHDAIPDPVTPNNQFYLISKNFVDPKLSEDDWSLEITGFVGNRMKLRYLDLFNMPSQEQMASLTCISNEVGGDLLSNAVWTGVKLADLLQAASVQPSASEVILYAKDGYTESLPLSKALAPTTMLVYLMNGVSLPKRHGFPARLIVPGKYGIKNVKWLTKIELAAGDFRGYWQQRGWTEDATIKTISRFDVPASRAIVPLGPVALGGVAFAGDRGIRAVELSIDDGDWLPVDELTAVGPLSWSLWRSTWNPPKSGTYALRVRATDGTGAIQLAEKAKPIPNGASGYHKIDIGVT